MKSSVRALLGRPSSLVMVTLVAALGSGCGGQSSPGTATHTTAVDGDGVLGQWVASQGLQRTYGLHVPPSCGGTRPCPLILAFHGAGGTHAFAESVGLFRAGDRGGFVVAAPDGIAGDWALGCGGCTVADQSGISDLRFVATLVTHLSRNLAIDTARVYATGRSDGGIFTHRLACNYPLAGAAVVAGKLFDAQACLPARAVPLIAFHGTADAVIPFTLGAGAVQYWAGLDGCAATPTVTALPDLANDGTTVTRQDFAPCRDRAEVSLFAIEGGGHNWPGSPTAESAGLQTHDLEASEQIVDFFNRHPPSANGD